MRSTWVIVSIVCALAGLWFALGQSQLRVAGSSPASDLSLACNEGQARTYEFSYRAKGQFDAGGIFPTGANSASNTSENSVAIDGKLRITCLKVHPSTGELVGWTLLSAEGNAQGFGMEAVAPSALVGATVQTRRHSNGTIGEIVFPEAWSGASRNIIRDMIAQQSFVLAGDDGWTAREEDVNGTYRANYATNHSSTAKLALTKTRLAYETDEGGDAQVEVDPATIAHINLAVSGRRIVAIESLQSTVKLRFLRGSQVFGTSESSFQLTANTDKTVADHSPAEAIDIDSLVAAHSDRLGDLAGHDAQRRIEQSMHREKLGKDTADSLELALQDAATGNEPVELFLKLRALFVLEPQASERFAPKLQQFDDKDPRFGALLSALAAAESNQAQMALVDVLASIKETPDKQLLILSQLGLLGRPTVETEDALRSYASDSQNPDVQQTARLALGNIARTLEPSATERARRIAVDAFADYRQAETPQARFYALMVLGNIGHHEIYAEVQRDLTNEDALVRGAAITALRFVDAPSVEDALLAAMEDKDGRVREAAIDSLSYRDVSSLGLAAMEQRLRQEPDERTRILILRALAKYARDNTALLAVIADRKQNDPAESVRDFADSVLLR